MNHRGFTYAERGICTLRAVLKLLRVADLGGLCRSLHSVCQQQQAEILEMKQRMIDNEEVTKQSRLKLLQAERELHRCR